MEIDHSRTNKGPLKSVTDAIRNLTEKPKVTNERINSLIYKAECIVFPGTQVHVCCITLNNGMHVFGYGSDVNQENAKSDRDLAIANARNKLWELASFQVQEEGHSGKMDKPLPVVGGGQDTKEPEELPPVITGSGLRLA